jgi:hypothetical protein
MIIRRQYTLPNCSLTLSGWRGETNPDDGGNGRPLLSIVVNAECRFTDLKHQSSVLQGDKDFLESLVRVVNNYAQSVLSGIIPQPTQDWVGESVRIKPLPEKNQHQLQFTRTEEGETEEIVKIDLTTVELFDLVEAIDQLLNDGATLPELTLSIQPRSRKIRGQNEPLAKKAKPAMAGVASLAVASIAFFFVPIPEIREPEPIPRSRREETQANPNNTFPSGVVATLADTPRITDNNELNGLAQTVRTTLDQNWEQRGFVEETLRYRVWVNPNGEIIGYEELSESDRSLTEAPVLPNVLSLSLTGEISQPPRVAELEVTFNPNGVVEVE